MKIESQTSLSEDEIQAKIAEAENFAEEDKQRKAKVELRNMADQVLYQTRRTLDESADKLDDDDVNPVKERLDELEKLVQDEDGKPLDIDGIDDAAIQAKVKERSKKQCTGFQQNCMRPLRQKWLSRRAPATMAISMLGATTWSMPTLKL